MADRWVQAGAFELVQRAEQQGFRPRHPILRIDRFSPQRVREHPDEDGLRRPALTRLRIPLHPQENVRVPPDRWVQARQIVSFREAPNLHEMRERRAHVPPGLVLLPTLVRAEACVPGRMRRLQPRHHDVPDGGRSQGAVGLRKPSLHFGQHFLEVLVRRVECGSLVHRGEAVRPNQDFQHIQGGIGAVEWDRPRQHRGHVVERWHHTAKSLAQGS
mmetsp:Transcript_21658/g.60469  ORF Transcript_21658/g.60469 Transcript_21658/m.60469 type:complete len:216 (+) Transcript_21658:2601-3248(+)